MSVGAGLPQALHGAGSPAAQKIMIARRSGMEKKIELAETVAGIRKDPYFETIVGKDEKDHWEEVRKKIKEQRIQFY